MHAAAITALLPFLHPGANVLDIGSGSGYLCAVFAHLVKPEGHVVGVEHIPQLCTLSEKNLKKSTMHSQMLEDGLIKIVRGDGRKGYAPGGTVVDALRALNTG